MKCAFVQPSKSFPLFVLHQVLHQPLTRPNVSFSLLFHASTASMFVGRANPVARWNVANRNVVVLPVVLAAGHAAPVATVAPVAANAKLALAVAPLVAAVSVVLANRFAKWLFRPATAASF
jgi:hypothetical protein